MYSGATLTEIQKQILNLRTKGCIRPSVIYKQKWKDLRTVSLID